MPLPESKWRELADHARSAADADRTAARTLRRIHSESMTETDLIYLRKNLVEILESAAGSMDAVAGLIETEILNEHGCRRNQRSDHPPRGGTL